MDAIPHKASHQAPTPKALTLDDFLIDDPKATVLLRARGGRSAAYGIFDGDLLAVERGSLGAPGDLIAVAADGALTAISFEQLQRRTSQEGCEPLGVVVSVARRVRK